MVRNYEITDISLQKIYAIVFGERISKSQRLTNWEADTLTTSQQSYAALDAWACLRLYLNISNRAASTPYHRPTGTSPNLPRSKQTNDENQAFYTRTSDFGDIPCRYGKHRLRPIRSRHDVGSLLFRVIGITIIVIILLHINLKRRERLRQERENDMNNQNNSK